MQQSSSTNSSHYSHYSDFSDSAASDASAITEDYSDLTSMSSVSSVECDAEVPAEKTVLPQAECNICAPVKCGDVPIMPVFPFQPLGTLVC